MFIFGLKAEEVLKLLQNGGYHSRDYYHYDKRIRQGGRTVDKWIFSSEADEFEAIYDSLIMENDQYFVFEEIWIRMWMLKKK